MAPEAYTPKHLAEKILTARSDLEGERKQVTVLFADIKGSTELIGGLDPEEARKLLDPALHSMMEAVHRYEGTVNQVLGDGIMALFGAPIAHEDHAARRLSEALPLLAQAVERAATCGGFADQALRVAWLSEAYLLTNQGDQARQLAEHALELSRTHQERGNQAGVRWLLGQIEVHHDLLAGEPAEENYRQALTLAEELGMRPLQAHCHLGLGMLYSKIGRVEAARAELSAAIALYRAMDMTFWLPQAETALVQVG